MSPDRGAAQTALLIHGLSGGPAEMRPLAAYLERDGFRCLTPTLIGHGTTVDDLKRVHLAEWLKQCEEQLLSLPEHVSLVCGLSFGAILALHLALRFPTRCKALVLLSPPLRLRGFLNEALLDALQRFPEWLLDFLPTIAKPSRPLSQRLGAYNRHSVGAAARVAKLRRSVLGEIATLQVPVLTLFDPHDHHLDPRPFEAPQFHSLNPRKLEGAEHEIPLGPRAGEAFVLIEEFLDKVRAEHA